MSNEETILNRIKNLIDLANDAGATEGEALAAMDRALHLLSKYNLDMTDVLTVEQQIVQEVQSTGRKNREGWICTIYNAAAQLFFCHVASGKIHNRHHAGYGFLGYYWTGEKQNIEVAKQMASYFEGITRRLIDEHCEGQSKTYRSSFGLGVATRLMKRVRDKRNEAKQAAQNPDGVESTSTALVLASQYEKADKDLEAYFENQKIKFSQVKFNVKTNIYAYEKGLDAGDEIPLTSPLSQKEDSKQLTGV